MALKHKVRTAFKHSKDLPSSLKNRHKYAEDLHYLHTFCLFIGYPRSGHSIIGALLDAHPDIVIAHEQDAVDYVEKGYLQNQIFYLLIRNSIEFAEAGRSWSGYSYNVQSQWQGIIKNPKIIGDNMGGLTTHRLYRKPALLQKIKQKINLELKFIHVIRNPFDNIATRARRGNLVKREVTQKMLEEETGKHFRDLHTNLSIQNKCPKKTIQVYHEDFVKNPKDELHKICEFLNVNISQDYLEDCAQIVKKSPHLSRNKVQWSNELVKKIEQEIEKIPFLRGYNFYE